jgi:uncharacterized protein YndB with AHSA1/START domain
VARANTTDEFFIGAPPQRVYESLVDPAAIPRWWPHARVRGAGDRFTLEAPALRRHSSGVTFQARLEGLRPGEGVTWWLERGELHGRAEWWLEGFKDGTIVHYYLDVERGDRGGARRMSSLIRRHRWALRRGVNALKDLLEDRG